MVLRGQQLGLYGGLCHLLDQPLVVNFVLRMRVFLGFTRVFCGHRAVCGLLICWDRGASLLTRYQFALATLLMETYLRLDAIKSGFVVELGRPGSS